ncbi:YciI family protein [Massilia sp. METH4]|uniref:YciI family protein n=1 Tax=Massilia sp. METH4 TaxID=3123041 RepID=UPI0030CA627B
MFIVTLKYEKPNEEIDQLLAAHRAFLREQYANGMFVLSGRMVPRTGGIIIANADSRADVEAVIELDPFKQAGAAQLYDRRIRAHDGCRRPGNLPARPPGLRRRTGTWPSRWNS